MSVDKQKPSQLRSESKAKTKRVQGADTRDSSPVKYILQSALQHTKRAF